MGRKIFFSILATLGLLFQIWSLHLTFTYPISNLVVDKSVDGVWFVNKIETGASSQFGIRIGDKIIEVNGQNPDEYFSVVKWHSLDQFSSVILERNSERIKVDSETRGISSKNKYLYILGELVSFLIAMFLFRKFRSSVSTRHLSVLFGNMGIIFMSLGASNRGDMIGKIIILTCVVVLPLFFLRFLMSLISEKASINISDKLIKIYNIVIGSSFCFFLGLLSSASYTYLIYKITAMLAMALFILGLLVNLTFLTNLYLKYNKFNSYGSILIKTIWVSLFISLAPITLFSLLPKLITGYEWINYLNMSWFIFILPLTFAYLIIAERLYDIDMLVRRILLNVTISLVPCIGLAAIVRVLFPEGTDARRLTIIFVLLLACMTFVLYSFEYFTTKLQPLLFPRKHQLQVALKKIAAKLSTTSSFRDLKDIILVDIVNTLQVVGGAIVFRQNDALETISEGSIDLAQVESLVQAESRRSADYSLIEINRHEEYTSYLIIGRKITGTMLGTEELQWIGLITSYLAVSLENVYLIRKLTLKLEQLALQIQNEDAALQLAWFRKLMFDLQERERTRIATELHDTTMQDLFFLKGRLHSLLEKYAYSDEDRAQLESMMDYIDVINMNLRQSCFELHPYMLKEIGLVKTIERLVEFEKPISSFELTFSSSGADIIEQKDLETKRHIFRMVQELLNNAKKHAEASQVRLVLTATAGSIYFEYEDNGVGFDPQRRASGEIGGSGIGMDQIRSRIFSLNGHFELATGQGKGVKIVATIPMQEGLIA